MLDQESIKKIAKIEEGIIELQVDMDELKKFSHSIVTVLEQLNDNVSITFVAIRLMLEKLNIDEPEEFKQTKDTSHTYL